MGGDTPIMPAILDHIYAVADSPLTETTEIATNLYQQSTGRLTDPMGELVGIGYSGNGIGLNNPKLQGTPMEGPIPQGDYEIGPAHTHPRLGALAMALTPRGDQELFGRSGFFIHGDNQLMDHTASEGCIILPRQTRALLAVSERRRLRVIA